tara:strand:+ start:608 stop:1321 length:714 start_codon:yes stop_codon:yes gene_type:complete
MKKLLLLLTIPFLSFGQNLTYVPDDNFEQFLINMGYDDVLDNYVLTSNINTLSGLSIFSAIDEPIFDITGIQDFTMLQSLSCSYNYLDEVDLSGMFYLQNVTLTGNYITCLNISNCPSLYQLFVENNFLEQLDISDNNSLEYLNTSGNPNLECIQYNSNIPSWFVYDMQNTTASDDCGYSDNLNCMSMPVSLEEMNSVKLLVKTIDILGRETTNNQGFQLYIYNDGSVEKKYLIKTL